MTSSSRGVLAARPEAAVWLTAFQSPSGGRCPPNSLGREGNKWAEGVLYCEDCSRTSEGGCEAFGLPPRQLPYWKWPIWPGNMEGPACLSRVPRKCWVCWSRAVEGAGEAKAALTCFCCSSGPPGIGPGGGHGWSAQKCELFCFPGPGTVLTGRGQVGQVAGLPQPSLTPTSAD